MNRPSKNRRLLNESTSKLQKCGYLGDKEKKQKSGDLDQVADDASEEKDLLTSDLKDLFGEEKERIFLTANNIVINMVEMPLGSLAKVILKKPNCRCRLSSPLLPRCPFERSSPNLRRFSSSIIRGKLFRGTSLSGFSWNSTTQLIEAENEVWDKLIESKPAAASLKTKKVSNFNEMLELFAKDRASGAQVETAKERNARLQKNDTINLETVPEVDDFLAANDVILESQYDIGDDIQVMHPMSSQPEHSSSAKKCKSRKRKVEHEDGDLTTMIINSVGGVANAIREGKKLFRRAIKY